MAVAVSNTKITSIVATMVENLATADTDALAEVFTITPTVSGGKAIIIIDISNAAAVAAADADITYSIAAGVHWASKVIAASVTKATKKVIQIADTARVMQADGTILLTLTPGANDKLKTNHVASVEFIELI